MTDRSTPERGPRVRRGALYAALALLFLLRYDLWLWSDARLVLGLPVGLLYHVGYCLVTSAVLLLLVRWAWPELEVEDAAEPGSEPGAPEPGA